MATTTSAPDFAGHIDTGERIAKRGFFGRLFDRLTAFQMRRAELHVRSFMVQLSDERLSDLGFTPDETRALRAKGTIPPNYWL